MSDSIRSKLRGLKRTAQLKMDKEMMSMIEESEKDKREGNLRKLD